MSLNQLYLNSLFFVVPFSIGLNLSIVVYEYRLIKNIVKNVKNHNIFLSAFIVHFLKNIFIDISYPLSYPVLFLFNQKVFFRNQILDLVEENNE